MKNKEANPMKTFMDKDFLLQTQTASDLYHDFAETAPILDYHCHINPAEIANDRKFDTITQVWLGGDHYNGVSCVPAVSMRNTSQVMLTIRKNSSNGLNALERQSVILFTIGHILNYSVTSATTVF